MKNKAPAFLKKYFWDIDFAKLDPKERPEYVIERILELGDMKAVQWVYKHFSLDALKSVVCKSNKLSRKTATFWGLILEIPQNRIRCLQPQFQKTHKTIWPY